MKTILTKQDVLELIAASRLESDKQNAELKQQIAASNAELKQQIAASNAELKQQIAASRLESDKQDAELKQQIAASRLESEKQDAELKQQMKELNKKMGELTDTMGEFAEGQVKPKILEMFRERGIELEETHEHVKIKKDRKLYVEIDLLLVNTEFMIVLEVKNTLQQKHVDEHLKRLDKLKTFCPSSMKGFTLLGAVAGMVVSESVEKYAFKKGFFVIRPKGEGIIISNKRNFKFQEWKIAK